MAITILNTPANSLTYKLYPVYNGLPYVVSSEKINRTNFKYVADIYVGSTLVSTLKHNKNITYNNKGIFDFGRIVENFLTTSRNQITNVSAVSNELASIDYQIKFGEEYERYYNFTTVLNSGGKARFYNATATNNFRVGDMITIQNSSVAAYNGSWTVTSVSSTSVLTNCNFVSTATGLVIESERFSDNYWSPNPGVGDFVGFAIPVSRPTRFNIGDAIVIKQDAGALRLGYDGEWTVTNIVSKTISGVQYNVIVTNCRWFGSSPVNPGCIYALSKYKFKNLTTSTTEYTFDGGLDWDKIAGWNPQNYAMNTTYVGDFLTNGPKEQYISLDEYATLSFFHSTIVASDAKKAVFKSYSSNGTLLNTYSYTIPTGLVSKLRLEIGTGTRNLLGNLSFAGVDYYTVELQNTASNLVSEVFKYKINTKCYSYTQNRLKFKNKLGGWDYFTFSLRSDKKVTIDRNNYNKNLKTLNSSNFYGYTLGERGNTTYSTTAIGEQILTSDWLNNAEASWLEELFTSPDVYLLNETNELPIIVTNTDFTIGKKENKGLISYKINIQDSFNKVIQRA